jgi:hypothetical protein
MAQEVEAVVQHVMVLLVVVPVVLVVKMVLALREILVDFHHQKEVTVVQVLAQIDMVVVAVAVIVKLAQMVQQPLVVKVATVHHHQ